MIQLVERSRDGTRDCVALRQMAEGWLVMRIILLVLGLVFFLSVGCPESGRAADPESGSASKGPESGSVSKDPESGSIFSGLFPTDEELKKYRKMWNPMSHGPMLQQAVDPNPQGQFACRPFIFSQIGEHSFGTTLSTAVDRKDGPQHLYQAQHPFFTCAYGVTHHLEFVAGASLAQTWWSNDSASFNKGKGGPWKTNTGIGDTSLMLKHRLIIQDPDTWRPSISFIHAQLSLPTGQWFTATKSPPGGFAPLGRFAATTAGALGITEGVMFRKNVNPFRFSGGLFYSYSTPGSTAGQNIYSSDLINARLVFEHFLNDKRGFGYNIEVVSLHGTTWRLDGHDINSGQRSGFDLIGVEPALQWRFGDTNLFGAAGVLFTVAGRNSLESMYPNFSIFYYFAKKGQAVLAR
jgi:hypothetical protein